MSLISPIGSENYTRTHTASARRISIHLQFQLAVAILEATSQFLCMR